MKVPLSNEILEKIKRITVKTRRIMTGVTQGSFRSVRKGMGLDFESLRDYMVGDDIRFIDWKASARSQSLLIKEFYQEQSLTIMIALDVSASMDFGSQGKKKIETAFELASAIILMAYYSGDSVGLVMYSDRVNLSIPAGKGVLHMQYLLETMIGFNPPAQGKTNIKSTIDFLLSKRLNNAFLFVISDAFEDDFCSTMTLFSHHYHLFVMLCQDKREHRLPTGGWLMIRDNETTLSCYGQLKEQLNQFIVGYHQNQSEKLSQAGAKIINAFSVDEGIDALIQIFNATVL
jgi:uncharacterized protein (DUF58 family)